MKKITLIIIFVFALSVSYGQENNKKSWFGVKAGVTIATLDGAAFGNQPHIGATAGFFYEGMVGRNVSWSVDLLYSGQGYREEDKELKLDERLDLHYVILPVMVNYYIVKGLAVKVGLQPGILAAAGTVDKSSYGVSKEKAGEGLRRFDLSIPMGISYDLKKFRIEARYNLGLLSIDKENEGGMENNWNSVFAITLGYKF